MLKLLYFATLRERMQCGEQTIPFPAGAATVQDLVDHLRRDPAAATAFANPSLIRTAVNQEFATPATPIEDGDEIAFFPPVTGG